MTNVCTTFCSRVCEPLPTVIQFIDGTDTNSMEMIKKPTTVKKENHLKRIRKIDSYQEVKEVLEISRPNPNPVTSWTQEDVSCWLESNGLVSLVDNFLAFEIDGKALLCLEEKDLEKMNLTLGKLVFFRTLLKKLTKK